MEIATKVNCSCNIDERLAEISAKKAELIKENAQLNGWIALQNQLKFYQAEIIANVFEVSEKKTKYEMTQTLMSIEYYKNHYSAVLQYSKLCNAERILLDIKNKMN